MNDTPPDDTVSEGDGARREADGGARDADGPAADARDTVVTAEDAAERAESAAAEADIDAADSEAGEGDAELEAMQQQFGELNERHLRLAAEFDNYRKRVEREREQSRTRAQAELVTRMLDVLDDLQRVADYDAEATSAEALLEGVELVEKKFRHALESAGLEPIKVEGEFFNPETMEALMTLPAEHPEEDEVVADVFQKGYRFRGRLVRPARVRVKKYESDE